MPDDQYVELGGQPISPQELSLVSARGLVETLQSGKLNYARLVECRRLAPPGGGEIVVFDVEIELGQRRVHDIRRHERIAALFFEDDARMPETLALRVDFPTGLPHTNLKPWDAPCSLCLTDESYDELQLRWTAPGYVERAREWLSLTARGKSHGEDQPLEPLLFGSPDYLVLPSDLFGANEQVIEQLIVRGRKTMTPRSCLIAERPGRPFDQEEALPAVAFALTGIPQPHGIIHRTPASLAELHDFLREAGIDLLITLRDQMRSWQGNPRLLDAALILVVYLPKTREASRVEEAIDTYAFMCDRPIRKIGEDIGLWAEHNGELGLILDVEANRRGQDVSIALLNPVYAFSTEQAAVLNGFASSNTQQIVAIGAGALGSQVFVNLMRAGFGRWTVIDKDILLPHNLARHALYGSFVGTSKAVGLSLLARMTMPGEELANPVVTDILRPGPQQQDVDAALQQATIILDISASVPVARYLARDCPALARRASLFFNTAGSDLVVLAEDATRTTLLDMLEMQYYRALIQDVRLRGHLGPQTGGFRYARSCGDISTVMRQDLIALHAAIGSRAVQEMMKDGLARITVWRAAEDMAVTRIDIPASAVTQISSNGWTLYTDNQFLCKISEARAARLPKETGGVLVGSYDMKRRIIYVVDTIPSPPDSEEWPTVYIRGCEGLAARVEGIMGSTHSRLEYIGEWHSHPQGHSSRPSDFDRSAFAGLNAEMSRNGLPPLMLIAGDNGDFGWYVQQML